MKRKIESIGVSLARPIIRFLGRHEVSPNVLTLIGLGCYIIVCFLLSRGWFLPAGIVLLIGGSFDSFDGGVARMRGKESRFGAFFDSATDRLEDFLVLFGFFLYYYHSYFISLLVVLTLFTTISVSYMRARAEGLGIECRVGLFSRFWRTIIMGFGLILLPKYYLPIIIVVLLVGTSFTIIHRFFYVRRTLRAREGSISWNSKE